ncbi:uncharacterized protein LOC117189505 isoform X1 [Drosophila miranda]|uniref:uncharacterized protein LOC117189505 isoform X1 n=1 Tax=Drosophila miranda TaxID=7229 RepID=UPI00143F2034|nr:uncharacterized protein LOC117189505 isoform X1 [Drosophila miranda]
MADPKNEMGTEAGTAMDSESGRDSSVSPMEINISNTNCNSMIVLNDLRLLELITKYPFLYSKAAQPEQDSEYDEWAWNQISKEFNASYENLPLSAPFSPDELQWRWILLLPTMGTLSKAKGQIPFQLWSLVTEIERSLSTENLEPPRDLNMAQNFLLTQLPLVEAMTLNERRRLEVEFLDILFQHEVPLGPEEQATVKTEYDEFLRSVRVKELPISALAQLSLDGPQYKRVQPKIAHTFAIPGPRPKTNLAISSVSGGQDLINVPTATVFIPIQAFTSNVVGPINPAPDVSTPLDINVIGAKKEPVECPPSVSPPLDIKTEVEVALAAIELAIEMENVRENNPEEAQEKSPEKNRTPVEKPDDATLNPNPRYIPIKSAKYYTKKLLVRVKRIDQDEYLPLSSMAKRPKKRESMYIKCT